MDCSQVLVMLGAQSPRRPVETGEGLVGQSKVAAHEVATEPDATGYPPRLPLASCPRRRNHIVLGSSIRFHDRSKRSCGHSSRSPNTHPYEQLGSCADSLEEKHGICSQESMDPAQNSEGLTFRHVKSSSDLPIGELIS